MPIVLVGKEYWAPLHEFIQKTIYEQFQAIDAIDMDLYTILDDPETIVDLINRLKGANMEIEKLNLIIKSFHDDKDIDVKDAKNVSLNATK